MLHPFTAAIKTPGILVACRTNSSGQNSMRTFFDLALCQIASYVNSFSQFCLACPLPLILLSIQGFEATGNTKPNQDFSFRPLFSIDCSFGTRSPENNRNVSLGILQSQHNVQNFRVRFSHAESGHAAYILYRLLHIGTDDALTSRKSQMCLCHLIAI